MITDARCVAWVLATTLLFALPRALCAQSSPEGVDAYRQKIERMSQPEREQLKNNFKRFSALAEADQKKLQQLDRQLKSDPRRKELQATIKVYYDWWSDLTPGQQEDLARETDPDARAALVREMLNAQLDRNDIRDPNWWKRRHLNPADLAAVLDELARLFREAVRDTRTLQDLNNAERKQGYERRLAINTLLPQYFGGRGGTGGARAPAWLTDEALAKLADKIADKENRESVLSQESRDERYRRLRNLVTAGLWAEYEKALPSDDELKKFFIEDLSPSQQDEIIKLPASEQRERQIEEYRRKFPEKVPPRPQIGRRGFRVPFGGGRGPGPGPRGGPDGPREGNPRPELPQR